MIRRIFAVLLTAVMFCMLFSSCVAEDTPTGDSTNPSTSSTPSISDTDTPTLPNDGDTIEPVIPDALIEIPSEYFSAADEQGTLVELTYDTWESKTYEQKNTKLTKRAIVYLPYGYDESKEYNTFYYMHGGWGNETTQMGTPERPSGFKNVIDHAIQNGEIEPMIVVCPTYNNENPDDSANYTLAFYTLTVNYHNELVNDLIPAVDSTYATIPDRDHRAFGGFSMGSVTTWYTFVNCLDEFRYFIPSSGAMDYQGDDVDAAVTASGHAPEDFFIFACTGTDDFEYRNFTNQIEGMLGMPSGNFVEGKNLVFYVKEGYSHSGIAATEYTYNGLLSIWSKGNDVPNTSNPYTSDSKISDVVNDPVFGDYGRLIFPVDEGYYSGETLTDLRLTWYSNIDVNKTVEIVNYMKSQAQNGNVIFYDIYTDAEKSADPDKADTGLFFFKGDKDAPFAVCNAGGGFAYVGAMHDSFPHALELSKKGYNAFALIYRPGAQTACEDLARAISFIFKNADKLGVSTDCYSVWGGSAGARMAAYLGTYGPAGFGGDDLPKPGTVIMQYTGHSEYSEEDPPTFVCVGKSDGIANWQTMQRRIDAMTALGISTEFHAYDGLGHGFGLGTGTVADGWLDLAVNFWEEQMQ
ncbi:MAG: esterase [Oscillospiraceae bacterium]|nr:esterase [Oscillospiraceae bacterium]